MKTSAREHNGGWPGAMVAVGLIGLLALAGGCAVPAGGTDADADGPLRLFNGKDLAGWEAIEGDYFDAAGTVSVKDGRIVLEKGSALTGVRWKGEFPAGNYEVTLDAMRIEGADFFCGMTFPVGGGHTTLILGGWGGSVVGLSNVDDAAAESNETTHIIEFANNKWVHVELLVSESHATLWLDDEKVFELPIAGKRFGVWPQQEPARPFGFTTYYTTGALRNIQLRRFGK